MTVNIYKINHQQADNNRGNHYVFTDRHNTLIDWIDPLEKITDHPSNYRLCQYSPQLHHARISDTIYEQGTCVAIIPATEKTMEFHAKNLFYVVHRKQIGSELFRKMILEIANENPDHTLDKNKLIEIIEKTYF